jgi:uncharacterized OB-fold protein
MTRTSPGAVAVEQLQTLIATVCESCGVTFSYHRDVCPQCGGVTTRVSGLWPGRVTSDTTVHRAPAGFESWTPYTVAFVLCDNGMRVLAVTSDATIDDHVVVGTLDIGDHHGVPVAIRSDRT